MLLLAVVQDVLVLFLAVVQDVHGAGSGVTDVHGAGSGVTDVLVLQAVVQDVLVLQAVVQDVPGVPGPGTSLVYYSCPVLPCCTPPCTVLY